MLKNRRYLAQAALYLLLVVMLAGVSLQLSKGPNTASAASPSGTNNLLSSKASGASPAGSTQSGVTVGQSYHNDTSPPLRDMPQVPIKPGSEREAAANPHMSFLMDGHINQLDPVVQKIIAPMAAPAPLLNFNGIPFPGVGCSCAPPDTDGEVGATQYVQMVNEGFQVFDKTTGASLLGPNAIESVWSGFGGACQTGGFGDPVVLYDQMANRWLISQFASATGGSPITDECIAVSTSSDATGTWNRYGFHLGSNFFDYPHLGVWPDAYYMSMNVFNAAGTTFLGPQPFAFNRAAMLAGTAATFIAPVAPLGSTIDPILPADLDGSNLPTSGAPETFVRFPGGGVYTTYHFHVDFTTPANSTWTTFASPAAAGFTALCASARACVPESGQTSANYLDGIGDRLMFRLAYRKFSDGHESLVGNYTVSSAGVAGIRWFELRGVTSGPETVFQESTYQPDTTWRWMGSAAMDQSGDIAVGFSASSSAIFPQVRYAGRLSTDAINTLGQGETTLFAGTGAQSGTGNRWGDYSDMTVDPVDDCTFWYTNEYYATTGTYNWRTRIGSFKFPGCGGAPPPTSTPTKTPTAVPTNTPAAATNTPTNTPTRTPTNLPTNTPTNTNTPIAGATNTPTNTSTKTPTNTPTTVPTTVPTNTSTRTPTNTPTPGGCSNIIVNGGFESGSASWVESSSGGYELIDGTRPHTGTRSAYLGDYNNARNSIYQTVSIPASSTSDSLSYWWYMTSSEGTTTAYDFMYVEVRSTSGALLGTLQTLSNRNTRNTWTQSTLDVSAWKGQTVRIEFRVTNDVSLPTAFFVDDVALNSCN